MTVFATMVVATGVFSFCLRVRHRHVETIKSHFVARSSTGQGAAAVVVEVPRVGAGGVRRAYC